MPTMRVLIILSGSWLFAVSAQGQTVWHVDDDAAPGRAGGTIGEYEQVLSVPGPQYPTIQSAIDAAADGDTVLVASGTYLGAGNKNLDFGGRLITVRCDGLAGSCIIDCENLGRGFEFRNDEPDDSVVDGFTITRGDAYDGGGMYILDSSPTVVNCTFTGNAAHNGGGVLSESHSSNSGPHIRDCVFNANHADLHGGGGFYQQGEGSSTLTDCLFENNTADGYGGGAYVGAGAVVDECEFKNNRADDGGGLASSGDNLVTDCVFRDNVAVDDGGAIRNFDSGTIADCTFLSNSAGDEGGAISNSRSPTITNCTFRYNSANDGGAVFNNVETAPLIAGCTFTSNYGRDGGAMHNRTSRVKVINSIFTANTGTGSVMYNRQGATPLCVNCTFSGNMNQAVHSRQESIATFVNSVFWGNAGDLFSGTDEPAVSYSNVEGGHAGIGNISVDPMFEDSSLRLSHFSPCIDAGSNAAVLLDTIDVDGDGDTGESWPWDMDRDVRFVDHLGIADTGAGTAPIVDMGAYEVQYCIEDGQCEDGDTCTGTETCGDDGVCIHWLSADCNNNGLEDDCDLAENTSRDCNENLVPDECDIADGGSGDCNENGVPDECDADCDEDGLPDECEIVGGGSEDCNGNWVPDECEADSDGDNVIDACDECPGVDDADFGAECVGAIPTVSEWGIAVLALLLLAAGKIAFNRRIGRGTPV